MDRLDQSGVILGRVVFNHQCRVSGREALSDLVDAAADYLQRLGRRCDAGRAALISRVRGTGPGASFGNFIAAIENEFPFALQSPFEECATAAGAVLPLGAALGQERDDALLKLRFEAGSVDLPMHAHEHSARFIFAVSGRGFFHVSSQSVDSFDGRDIRYVPIRPRDALMFMPGTMHTFSAPNEPLVLFSYHAPYVPLDDPRQYTLPTERVYPMQIPDVPPGQVACDPAWSVLN